MQSKPLRLAVTLLSMSLRTISTMKSFQPWFAFTSIKRLTRTVLLWYSLLTMQRFLMSLIVTTASTLFVTVTVSPQKIFPPSWSVTTARRVRHMKVASSKELFRCTMLTWSLRKASSVLVRRADRESFKIYCLHLRRNCRTNNYEFAPWKQSPDFHLWRSSWRWGSPLQKRLRKKRSQKIIFMLLYFRWEKTFPQDKTMISYKIGSSSSSLLLLFSGNDKLIFVFLSNECLSFFM